VLVLLLGHFVSPGLRVWVCVPDFQVQSASESMKLCVVLRVLDGCSRIPTPNV